MSTSSRRLLPAVAIAALAVAVLSSCATVPRPRPPAPTGTELAQLTDRELELQWQYIGLTPDSPKPTIDVVRYISPGESKGVYDRCMSEAGFPFYSTGPTAGADNYERLAVYTCVAKYPLPPGSYGLFSDAQHDYLYDYYEDTLIPCIRSAGIRFDHFPSRDDYKQTASFGWNPLDQLTDVTDDLRYVIESRCAAYPVGFDPWNAGIDQ